MNNPPEYPDDFLISPEKSRKISVVLGSMEFKSERGVLFGIGILGPAAGLGAVILADVLKAEASLFSWGNVILFLIVAFLLWIWIDTGYSIREKRLFYRSGPFRGSIPVSRIRELVNNRTLWSGLKPALATKGIIVRYNRYDEIYISPSNRREFIQALLAINGEIKVIETAS